MSQVDSLAFYALRYSLIAVEFEAQNRPRDAAEARRFLDRILHVLEWVKEVS